MIQDIETLLPTIKQKIHSCVVMTKMEDRHRVMMISDINCEIGDIQIIISKLRNEIEMCNYYCTHKTSNKI